MLAGQDGPLPRRQPPEKAVWTLDVGGSVIAAGMIFVVSGYPSFGAMPGNALLAFSAS